jgi:dethiobiotin synthetase
VLIVSRNYLGSINHSLLTAQTLKGMGADVIGWIFNDQYLQYEQEIADWSGYPRIGSIPFVAQPNKAFVAAQAAIIRPELLQRL